MGETERMSASARPAKLMTAAETQGAGHMSNQVSLIRRQDSARNPAVAAASALGRSAGFVSPASAQPSPPETDIYGR